jgi:hypothetical protein
VVIRVVETIRKCGEALLVSIRAVNKLAMRHGVHNASENSERKEVEKAIVGFILRCSEKLSIGGFTL